MTLSRFISFIFVAILVACLIAVRAFEVALFQDPLRTYFLGNFQLNPVPDLDVLKQFFSTSFRYVINTVISLWILWFLYKKETFINAALWVYLFAFVVLSISFMLLLNVDGDLGKMALFYTRRFLIHPILLFVMVAGFYFLKNNNKLNMRG